jgi:hypothetical protein
METKVMSKINHIKIGGFRRLKDIDLLTDGTSTIGTMKGLLRLALPTGK